VLATVAAAVAVYVAGAPPAMAERPEHLIAGGLLGHELDEVAAAFAERLGLCERERRQSGEWAALWLSAR